MSSSQHKAFYQRVYKQISSKINRILFLDNDMPDLNKQIESILKCTRELHWNISNEQTETKTSNHKIVFANATGLLTSKVPQNNAVFEALYRRNITVFDLPNAFWNVFKTYCNTSRPSENQTFMMTMFNHTMQGIDRKLNENELSEYLKACALTKQYEISLKALNNPSQRKFLMDTIGNELLQLTQEAIIMNLTKKDLISIYPILSSILRVGHKILNLAKSSKNVSDQAKSIAKLLENDEQIKEKCITFPRILARLLDLFIATAYAIDSEDALSTAKSCQASLSSPTVSKRFFCIWHHSRFF